MQVWMKFAANIYIQPLIIGSFSVVQSYFHSSATSPKNKLYQSACFEGLVKNAFGKLVVSKYEDSNGNKCYVDCGWVSSLTVNRKLILDFKKSIFKLFNCYYSTNCHTFTLHLAVVFLHFTLFMNNISYY